MANPTVGVSGHFDWGLHESFEREHMYFVVMRDPIERALSLYDYVVAQKGHKQNRLWSATPVDRLLARNPATKGLSNGQVRQIGGAPPSAGPPDAALLERAWQNLCQENVIVTFTDRLDDGLMQLGGQIGLPFRAPRRRHNPVPRSIPSTETIEIVREANALDIELYDRARSLFATRLESPARLPQITPLELYRERIDNLRRMEASLDQLASARRALFQMRQENMRAARALEDAWDIRRWSWRKVKKVIPLRYRTAIKKRFHQGSVPPKI